MQINSDEWHKNGFAAEYYCISFYKAGTAIKSDFIVQPGEENFSFWMKEISITKIKFLHEIQKEIFMMAKAAKKRHSTLPRSEGPWQLLNYPIG